MRGGYAAVTMPVERDDGETFGSGDKLVEDATLELRGRAPGPAKRVLTVETSDGWVYRFQRYGPEEPWVRWDRIKPDGEVKSRRGQIPGAVVEYVAAVEDAEVLPELDDMIEATQAVGDATMAAVTDGGEDQPPADDVDVDDDGRVECKGCGRRLRPVTMEPGPLCPLCHTKKRTEEASVERARRTTWVDDPDDPDGYRDEPPRGDPR